ncbi:MAG: glycosyltransferase family 1 protein, partial [Gemmatimonadota bacterium]|nr:glycosyltransferase family 1 protein [Gemmatimonadota bacterium]
ATMHDVSPIRVPRNAFSRWKWTRRYRATARASRIILTVSEFSAREIRYLLGVPASRIRVVSLAAEDLPDGGSDDDRRRLARLGVPSRYVLSVGGADPRKRLDVLGAAMGEAARRVSGLSWVHAGPAVGAEAIAGAAACRMVGEVHDADLGALYRGALALAYPSVYEGFGLPLLEAMQAGTPVIAAHAAALPEVGRDAVIWTHPGDVLSLAHAIEAVATNPVFRGRLSERGRGQAARFSWERAARQTLEAFDAAMPRSGKSTPPAPRPAAA